VLGWCGESGLISKLPAYLVGVACYCYLCYEIFSGEICATAAKMPSNASREAYATLRLIVVVGWTIAFALAPWSPVGFCIAYSHGFNLPLSTWFNLNIIFNFGEIINKGLFGLCLWQAAAAEKEGTLL